MISTIASNCGAQDDIAFVSGSSSTAIAISEPTTTPSSNVLVPSPSLGELALAHILSSESASYSGPLGLVPPSLSHISLSLLTSTPPIPASARDVNFYIL